MVGGLRDTFDSVYLESVDPWSYWSSRYELHKYHRQIELVRELVDPRRILEIGCSTGSHTGLILEAFPSAHVTAIDVSPIAVERATQRLGGNGRVSLSVADIFVTAADLPPESFDLIFWSEGFDYLHAHCTIEDFSKLSWRLASALTHGGLLCVSHILPDPLSYRLRDAGTKNVTVFHALLADYFETALRLEDSARKEETGRYYRYLIALLRPRLLGTTSPAPDTAPIGQVDVVIPARDESETIGAVVDSLRRSPRVDRILVVDNGSADDTALAAAAAGATVLDCPSRGYGRAVKHGLAAASTNWVLKFDADIENADCEWVERLIREAEDRRSNLVKACWPPSLEDPDRVTNFTVRPAFEIFFPELAALRSPLSGIYLVERAAFDLDGLPDDFSFDVAMLVAQLRHRRITSETEIEAVRHASIANGKRTYQHYHRMSCEILRYIVEAGLARVQ